MACDLKTLLNSACANDFVQLAASDPKLARAVILQLLCNISAGGGGTGGVNNFAGSGPPTTQVPANGAGTYWDYTNGIQYQWNPVISGWTQ